MPAGAKESVMPAFRQSRPASRRNPVLNVLYCFLLALCPVVCDGEEQPRDLEAVVKPLQQRYADVETITGSYRQTYRGPGIDQEESGRFWLKRPGLMRLECNHPEEKLFVADGRKSFHYIPQDHQVYMQQLTASDLRDTPLGLLLGTDDIRKNYTLSWETDIKPEFQNTSLIRLTPRNNALGYSFVVLEIDRKTWIFSRILIRQTNGDTTEYFLSNATINVKIDNDKFRFKVPKGVEIIQMSDER